MMPMCYNNVKYGRNMNMDYPRMLREYREKTFLTQEDLARKLGVSYVTVNRWENGKFEPTMKIKRKLNKLFIKEGLVSD